MDIGHAHAPRVSGNLRVVPFNGESDRRVAEHAEVVAIVSVFRDVLTGKYQESPERLLDASVELVAKAGIQCPACSRRTEKKRRQDRILASDTRKNEILVERRFQRACVRNSKHGAGLLDVVRDTDSGFGLARHGEAVVKVAAQ